MAQLPPRVPNMAANWPQFSTQKMISSPILDQNMGGGGGGGSWVDELLDFSATKRGSHGHHRRSMSDSVAFLDIPMAEECRRSSNILPLLVVVVVGGGGGGGGGSGGVFDADEQLIMSMFNTDAADDIIGGSGGGGPNMSCSNPSSPSDLNNNNMNMNMNEDEKQQQQMMKSEPEEVESSSSKSDQQGSMFAAHIIGSMDNSNDKILDPKRIKRILANRQSAQRSRVRKLQYVSELERSVTSLQAEISVLSPRVAYLDHQRLILGVDNSVLKQRIAALSQDKIFKDAHQEALKRELERLREVYNYQQNLKKKENASQHELKSQPSPLVNAYAEKEQLAN